MRVLGICHEDPYDILGGMGMHLRELYKEMAKRDDVEIDLLTSGPEEGSFPCDGYTRHVSDKLICYKPKSAGLASLYASDIQMIRKLTQLLAAGKRWDLVHVHEWGSLQVARLVRDALNIPMVGTLHLCLTKQAIEGTKDPKDLTSDPTQYMMQQEGHLAVDTDEFIVCSKAYEKIARKFFLTRRHIHIIYNGINREEWHPGVGNGIRARATHNVPPKDVCLYVGRIADMKGIRPLLDAIEARDTGYFYVLAGMVAADTKEQAENWDVTKRMRKMNEELPGRFKWVDFQHGEPLKDLFAAASIGIMPSTEEPFGIAALEHMAMGVPLISTQVEGLGEVVNDEAGGEYSLIIEPNDPGQIVAAVETLKNKDKRDELTRLGLKRAKDFTWEEVAEQTVEVYNTALERRRHGRQTEPAARVG